MNKFEVSGVVLLVLKKTFDLVDHDLLLTKLAIDPLQIHVLYHFENYIFLIERTASYSMVLPGPYTVGASRLL